MGDKPYAQDLSREEIKCLDKIEVLSQEKRYDQVILLCTELIKKNPDLYMAYSKRSYAFLSIEEYEKAFADIDTLVKLRPDSPGPYFKRGYSKLEIGYYKNAVDDLTFVINTGEYYFLDAAYFFRSLAYYKLGKKKEALNDCLQLQHDFSHGIQIPGEAWRVYTKDSLREMIIKMR